MQEVTLTTRPIKVRIVTAASLFDGHDAAINIMRRIIQATGVEVIHLGHDRSVEEVVNCAIQEDANAIAMTSYQGGHVSTSNTCMTCSRKRGRSQRFWWWWRYHSARKISELHDWHHPYLQS